MFLTQHKKGGQLKNHSITELSIFHIFYQNKIL